MNLKVLGIWYDEPILPPLPLKDAEVLQCQQGWTGIIGGGEYYQGNSIIISSPGWSGSAELSKYILPGETATFKFATSNEPPEELKIGVEYYDGNGTWGGVGYNGYAKLKSLKIE